MIPYKWCRPYIGRKLVRIVLFLERSFTADFARQMKEVTLAALDRITKEVQRLSESVQKVNERQAHFKSVLKLGTRPTEEQQIDLGPGEDSPLNEDGDAAVQYRSVQAKEACVLKEVKGILV